MNVHKDPVYWNCNRSHWHYILSPKYIQKEPYILTLRIQSYISSPVWNIHQKSPIYICQKSPMHWCTYSILYIEPYMKEKTLYKKRSPTQKNEPYIRKSKKEAYIIRRALFIDAFYWISVCIGLLCYKFRGQSSFGIHQKSPIYIYQKSPIYIYQKSPPCALGSFAINFLCLSDLYAYRIYMSIYRALSVYN